MKNKFISLFLFLCLFSIGFAQSPESFNYQSVVRDASGMLIANQSVSFRISILQGSATGTAAYVETHTVTTNDYGLANFQIGNGTVTSGMFSGIPWGSDVFFVQLELDAAGGCLPVDGGKPIDLCALCDACHHRGDRQIQR